MESIRNAAASAANTASSYIYGDNNETGTTGTTGTTSSSGLPQSLTGGSSATTQHTTSGPHGSDLANKADPRVDSDRDGSSTGYGSSITGTSGITGQHNTSGPHDSDLANRADPRVDSDRDGSSTFGNTGTGYGSSSTGTSGITGQHNTSGPHDSDLANRADPRVDSDRDGSSTGYGSSSTGTSGITGQHNTSGPHNSDLANRADPRVDSDRDGSSTGYGSSSTGTSGITGQHNTAGPHDSDLANRVDPRVDSDRDGSNTFGNTGTSSFTGGSSFTNTQSGTEPVSGETGRGTATEPYDQGNQYDEDSASAEEPLGHAISNHGPHSTFIGNILDPKTADAAREKTFGPSGEPESYGEQTQSHGGQTQSYEGQPQSSNSGLGGTTGSQSYTSGHTDDTSSQSYLENNPRYQGGKRIEDHSPSGHGISLSGRSGTDNQGYETGQQSYGSTQQSGHGQGQDNSSSYSGSTLGGQHSQDRTTTQHSQSGFAPTGNADTSVESRGADTYSNNTARTSGGGAQGVNTGGIVRSEHDTDKTGVHSFHQNDPHGSDVRPSEANEDRPNVNAGGFGTAEPSVGADPKSAQQPTQKHQGADRPTDEPTGEQADAVREKKDEGEAALNRHDPNDHSGEPMHMHTGKKETEQQEHPGQEGGGEHGKEKGTGEEWVKSSGLQADGGNFDAAAPGAGREADRLLESKGIHKDERGAMLGENDEPASAGDHSGDHEKKSGGLSKLKEKLHIGSTKH